MTEKPTLEAVLDAYDVRYSSRVSQMVSCPLHEDLTPSCSINRTKQLWNCMSCGEGGDSWELIKLKEGVSFAEAKRFAESSSLATRVRGARDDDQYGRWGRRSDKRKPGRGAYVPAWRR